MPVGDNTNNLMLFELGIVKRTVDVTATDVATIVTIHPMLTAPASMEYTDASRSAVTQTVGGAVDTRGGRALRRISMDGTFGVEERRTGPFGGSGDLRFNQFLAEIVRFGDAVSRKAVLEAVGSRIGSLPTVQVAAQTFNERTDIPYINFYDLLHGVSLQVVIRSFRYRIAHRGGGASKMHTYSMVLEEVGPAVAASVDFAPVPDLMAFQATWQSLNRIVGDFDPQTTLDGNVALGTAFGRDLVDLAGHVLEVSAHTENVVALLSGGSPRSDSATLQVASSSSVAGFLGLVQTAIDIGDAVSAPDNYTLAGLSPRVDAGILDFATDLPPVAADFAAWDEYVNLYDVLDALAAQLIAGSFYGMDHEAYTAFLESNGAAGPGPIIGGSVQHVVSDTDAVEWLEELYGVPWAVILATNAMTPNEALITGTTLEIPVVRAAGPQSVDGLPTFGSHVGREAWGIDLAVTMESDGDGGLLLVEGTDVLEQGQAIAIEGFAAELQAELDSIPPAGRQSFIIAKLAGLVEQDQRIVGVVESEITQLDTGLAVELTIAAINGGTVVVGGPT